MPAGDAFSGVPSLRDPTPASHGTVYKGLARASSRLEEGGYGGSD